MVGRADKTRPLVLFSAVCVPLLDNSSFFLSSPSEISAPVPLSHLCSPSANLGTLCLEGVMLLTLQRKCSKLFELVLNLRHKIAICCWAFPCPLPTHRKALSAAGACADTDIDNSSFEGMFYNKAGLEKGSKPIICVTFGI